MEGEKKRNRISKNRGTMATGVTCVCWEHPVTKINDICHW